VTLEGVVEDEGALEAKQKQQKTRGHQDLKVYRDMLQK
jgi:hypothetical protein